MKLESDLTKVTPEENIMLRNMIDDIDHGLIDLHKLKQEKNHPIKTKIFDTVKHIRKIPGRILASTLFVKLYSSVDRSNFDSLVEKVYFNRFANEADAWKSRYKHFLKRLDEISEERNKQRTRSALALTDSLELLKISPKEEYLKKYNDSESDVLLRNSQSTVKMPTAFEPCFYNCQYCRDAYKHGYSFSGKPCVYCGR